MNQPNTNAGVTHSPQSAEETQKAAFMSPGSQNKGAARAQGTPPLTTPLGWKGHLRVTDRIREGTSVPPQPGNHYPELTITPAWSKGAPSLFPAPLLHRWNKSMLQPTALPASEGTQRVLTVTVSLGKRVLPAPPSSVQPGGSRLEFLSIPALGISQADFKAFGILEVKLLNLIGNWE